MRLRRLLRRMDRKRERGLRNVARPDLKEVEGLLILLIPFLVLTKYICELCRADVVRVGPRRGRCPRLLGASAPLRYQLLQE